MDILEAYDLFRSYRAAARHLHCSPNTVKKFVLARDRGEPLPKRRIRIKLTDAYLAKIEELVTRSEGKIMGTVVYENLVAMGFTGSYKSTTRAVRQAKNQYLASRRRAHRPWIPAPGQWLQYDYGDGPVINGRKTVLFVAWLAWSKFRFVLPLYDKQMPSVIGALDACFRTLGGVPSYVLTDNEKTVTIDHVCNLPIRNQRIVSASRWYGTTIHTCVPYDPASKGGVENAVKLAKSDLVPTSINLRAEYKSFTELNQACCAWVEKINNRKHAAGFIPAERLKQELAQLHTVPSEPYEIAVEQQRKVAVNTPMVVFNHTQYSVPYSYMGKHVLVRESPATDEVIIVSRDGDGITRHIACHPIGQRGDIVIDECHFPPDVPSGPQQRHIKARSGTEAKFLDIGQGAYAYIAAATQSGVSGLKQRLSVIIDLCSSWPKHDVDQALATAASVGRFMVADIESILSTAGVTSVATPPLSDEGSLAQGTSGWAKMGQVA